MKKYGFIINERFYENKDNKGDKTKTGHEHNARHLIEKFGWEKQWNFKGDAQDFMIKKKGAIQIGSGRRHNIIVASKNTFHTMAELEAKVKSFGLYGYEIQLIEW